MRLCVLTTSFPKDENDPAGIFILHYINSLPRETGGITVLTPHKKGAFGREKWGRINIKRFKYFFPSAKEKLLLEGGIMINLKRYRLAVIQLPLFFIIGFFQALKYARKSDILHANWIFYGLIGALISKFLKKPLVITLHGSDVELIKSSNIFRKMGIFALNQAESLVCVSEFLKNEISKYVKDTNKIKVYPNGVGNLEKFLNIKQREKTGPTPVLLWVGRFSPEKNVPLLLKATRLIKEKIPGIRLNCLGSGPLLGSMKKLAEEYGLKNNVIFSGQISHGQIHKYFAKADVFVLTSQREGFGVVLTEAMASGLPVVASRTGSIPEIIDDQQNGYLCHRDSENDFAEKIVALLMNPRQRLQFGLNGRQKVREKYNWQNISDDIYREIYLKLYG